MYNILTITEDQATEFFFSDPNLVLLGLSDQEIASMFKTRRYEFLDGSDYVGAWNKQGELVAVLRYEYFTTHAVNYHMYISTKHQKTNAVRDITMALRNYVRDVLKIYKLIVIVPSPCGHIHKFAPKWGMKKEGVLTNSFQWREQIVDLVIYGLDLERPNGDKQ